MDFSERGTFPEIRSIYIDNATHYERDSWQSKFVFDNWIAPIQFSSAPDGNNSAWKSMSHIHKKTNGGREHGEQEWKFEY